MDSTIPDPPEPQPRLRTAVFISIAAKITADSTCRQSAKTLEAYNMFENKPFAPTPQNAVFGTQPVLSRNGR
jgi:hypothetical protein